MTQSTITPPENIRMTRAPESAGDHEEHAECIRHAGIPPQRSAARRDRRRQLRSQFFRRFHPWDDWMVDRRMRVGESVA